MEGLPVADEIHLALKDVKTFILPVVDMEWRAESRGSKLVEKGDAADTVSRARLPGHQRADKPGRVALAVVQDHWLRRLRFHMPSFG